MKAMILCAGFGTRMGELTKNCPKPMLNAGGRPILDFTLRHLRASGITEVGINLHYLPHVITDFLGDGSQWGLKIHTFYENAPSGTAGAAKVMESMIGDSPFFTLLYGDILTNHSLVQTIAAHQKSGAQATVVVHQRKESNSLIEMDPSGCITTFLERPPKTAFAGKTWVWVNSGIYILNREILDIIPPQQFWDFPKDVFPSVMAAGRLYGYPLTGYRYAIDSPERLQQAERELHHHAEC